jgi:hypothetical protein
LIALAVSALVAMLALAALCAAAVIGLGFLIGAGMAALLVGVGLAAIGGIIASVGISRLKRTHLKPKETIRSLKEDKEWLKDMT